MLYLSGINFESIVDGNGVRCVLYISGCKHNCPGCHNPRTHSFTCGKPLTETVENEIFEFIKTRPYISGITFSGGDPMFSASEVLQLLERFKKQNIKRKIDYWLYTGFTFEQILAQKGDRLKLMLKMNYIVDGRFIQDLYREDLLYRGSSNQRIIDVKKSMDEMHVIELDYSE